MGEEKIVDKLRRLIRESGLTIIKREVEDLEPVNNIYKEQLGRIMARYYGKTPTKFVDIYEIDELSDQKVVDYCIYRNENITSELRNEISKILFDCEIGDGFSGRISSSLKNSYNIESDVIVIYGQDIFGLDHTFLYGEPTNGDESFHNDMMLNISTISRKKGFNIVSLGCNINTTHNANGNILKVSYGAPFDAKKMENLKVFGETCNVMIPNTPLSPGGLSSAKEYVESGRNPYSNWEFFHRDIKTNVIYALSNKSEISIVVCDHISKAIEMIRYELVEGVEKLNKKIEYIYEEGKTSMLKVFSEKTEHDLLRNYNDAGKEIEKGYDKLEEMMKKYGETSRQIQDAERERSFFDVKKMKEECKDLAESNFNKTYKLKGVSHMEYVDGKIYVYTDNIYQHSKRKRKWYDKGTFKIEINWSQKSFEKSFIKVYPTKWDNKSSNYVASHVMKNNTLCFGTSMNVFSTSYGRRDIFGIVFHILDFLRNQNENDTAAVCENFPLVSEGIVTGDYKKELSYADIDPDIL